MADYTPAQAIANNLHEQNMAALGQLGNVLQKDAIIVSKFADYDFMEGKRIVDLTEAMGAREVASEKNVAGGRDGQELRQPLDETE